MNSVGRDNLWLAIAAILSACLVLSLGDALIKRQSGSFVIWQIFVMRSAIAIPFLIYFLRLRSCDLPLLPVTIGWTLGRSLILVMMWVFYFVALPRVDLAIAAAAYYTLPIFITLFAAIFLDDKIGVWGWIATLLGFIGCLLILQPQAEDFNAYALLPIVAAVCYAAAMLITRSKCRNEDPILLSLWLNFSFIGVGAIALIALMLWRPDFSVIVLNPFLFGEWTPMWLAEWRMMAILAIAIVVGSISAAFAYQRAPSSIVATFDFSYVAFAVCWGYLFFAETPAPPVILGILIIVLAGILATRQQSA